MMTIAKWLDEQEEKGRDVSHIQLPDDLAFGGEPDETLYFKEIRPCSILCTGSHPFATVERFGHWFYSRGRDKDKGPHTSLPMWWLFTKERDLAIQTAIAHIEKS
ncbi:MAG: hypothetical protein R6W75_04525 [Smithellaceae bacterium]